MAAYFAALDPMTLVRALPGNVAQGIIWGIMALGVYITFRILDFAGFIPARMSITATAPPVASEPSTVRSAKSSIRNVM